jgi:hypothetical protein
MGDTPILEVESKDEGRNAKVRLFADRIEREKPRGRLSMSSARQDFEVTPVRAVSSVQAVKDGFSTKVIVFASGNTIEFRIHPHDAAHRFKDELTRLMLAGGTPAPAAAAPVDRLEQLSKLADLKAQGVLSDEEFEAEKARIMAATEPAAPSPEPAAAPSSSSSSGAAIAGRTAAAVATGGLSEAARLLRRKK